MVLAVSNSVASGWFGGSRKEARVSLQDEPRRNNDGQILFFLQFRLPFLFLCKGMLVRNNASAS